jgi:hypothetical protein
MAIGLHAVLRGKVGRSQLMVVHYRKTTMASKYHLYMDEAGEFEGTRERIDTKKRRPLIFGLLVPDEQKDLLAQDYEKIADKRGYEGFIHAHELAGGNQKKFKEFCTKLVNRTVNSPILPFVIRFEGDLLSELPENYQESFAANRYLNMAQAVIEHLFFLHPGLLGKDLRVAFHPNSRVYPIPNTKVDLQQTFSAMGFRSFAPARDGCNPPSAHLTH